MKISYVNAQTGQWCYREATISERMTKMKEVWEQAKIHIEQANALMELWDKLDKENKHELEHKE